MVLNIHWRNGARSAHRGRLPPVRLPVGSIEAGGPLGVHVGLDAYALFSERYRWERLAALRAVLPAAVHV